MKNVTPKEAYKEFDKQTKRELEEAEIRNCPVRGPILKKMDEVISKSRKELCDWLMSDEKPTVGVPNIDMRSKHDFVFSSDDRMMKEFESSPLLNDKLTDLQVYRFVSDKPKREIRDMINKRKFHLGTAPASSINLNFPCTMAPLKKETRMIDFSTTKGGDAAKAFRELGKVIDNLNKQREAKMIDLPIGSTVIISDKFNDCRNDAAHLLGVPVEVMATFNGLGLDNGERIQMVVVSNKGGSSCCFRADMCKSVDNRTDEEKAIDDLIKPALIFAASSGSYQKDAEKFLNVIKADEIHGVKWVVE